MAQGVSVSNKRSEQPSPCQRLLEGINLWIWEENDASKVPLKRIFRCDENAYYLSASSDDPNKEILWWDVALISDVRQGKIKSKSDKGDKSFFDPDSSEDPLEDRSLVIMCRRDGLLAFDKVYVLAGNLEDAEAFKNGINYLAGNVCLLNLSALQCLKKHYDLCLLHSNGHGQLPLKSIRQLFRVKGRENDCPITNTLQARGFLKSSEDGMKFIHCKDFMFELFMEIYTKVVNHRGDVQDICSKFSKKGKNIYLGAEEFHKFVTEQRFSGQLQNEILVPPPKMDEVLALIDKYEPGRNRTGTTSRLTPRGLLEYLLSEENPIIPLSEFGIHMDMTKPLNDYFINSSHNTYLTGNQLKSASTVEMYIQALLLGCRCIELDCWVYKREIVITHGGTLCTKIYFRDVLMAIRDYAFVASDYPVILSIENHVKGEELLQSMANLYHVILGEYLLKEPLTEYPIEQGLPLPPLDKLKRKIIIKDKIRRQANTSDTLPLKSQLPSIDEELQDSVTLDRQRGISRRGNSTLIKHNTINSISSITSEEDASEVASIGESITSERFEDSILDDQFGDDISYNELATKVRLVSEGEALISGPIVELLNYCTAVKFESFQASENMNSSRLMSSFDEDKGFTLLKNSPVEFVKYNMRQNSRVYPAGARFNSSNYMPQVYWNAGCQMVALNYQTPDLAMQLNLAKFEFNGNCGYLLKPAVLRITRPQPFHPLVRTPIDNVTPVNLSIKIVSGQFLSEGRVFVEVELFGLAADTSRRAHRTKPMPGPHPVWGIDEKAFDFKRIIVPELALLRFSVFDENNQFVGQRTLPVYSVNAGYRHIVLRDKWNQVLGLSTLFVHITSKIYVPDQWGEAVEALMDPISHMKKQLRSLMEDIQEEELELAMKNPHLKVLQRDSLIKELNLPPEMMTFGTFGTLKPAKPPESLPPVLDQARSREQPGATGFNNPSIKHDKQVIELEKKMKQADSKIRKNIEEKQTKARKKLDKQISKSSSEKREMLVEEKDAKLKELGNILERKQLLSKGKFEEKIFKTKKNLMDKIHKSESLELESKHKAEISKLSHQTSAIATTVKAGQSQHDISEYAYNKFTRWKQDIDKIHRREKEAWRLSKERALEHAERERPINRNELSKMSNGAVTAEDEFQITSPPKVGVSADLSNPQSESTPTDKPPQDSSTDDRGVGTGPEDVHNNSQQGKKRFVKIEIPD